MARTLAQNTHSHVSMPTVGIFSAESQLRVCVFLRLHLTNLDILSLVFGFPLVYIMNKNV